MEFKEVRECKVLYISKVYETPIHEFRTPYYIKTCSYVLLSLNHVLLSYKTCSSVLKTCSSVLQLLEWYGSETVPPVIIRGLGS